MKKNNIYLGDNLELFKCLEDESIDMIFADPPYFMQTEGKLIRVDGSEFDGVKDEWDKFANYEEYDKYCEQWISECKRVLKSDGVFWVIGSFQNIYRIGKLLQDLDFWIINDIVWSKSNPVPNFMGTRFVNSHETLLCVTKSKKSKFVFNYQTMKRINSNKQMKSVWNIPITSSSERLKDEKNNKIHSTQKPEKLMEYIILSTTNSGDTVLDPFSGSGTTAAVAKKLGRSFIGFELDKKYYEASIKRIDSAEYIPNIYTEAILDIKAPLVPFSKLIKDGYISLQGTLLDINDCEYRYDANGNVEYNQNFFSIHKLAALLNNKVAFNGWDYWRIKDEKGIKSIKEIRDLYRKEVLNFELLK
ncbi:site-specific DNA-methyltransferase [Mesoplasma seiffertii]|uniref:site-specific DNA-methyltransferase n=1 Tax=Mesoplasma seiffertii TaxID=28224 RepID=UPI000479EA61|nr:DNA methyltransferase [Mesoplasma seiffertii]